MAIIVSVPTSRAGKYGEMVGEAIGQFVEGKRIGEKERKEDERREEDRVMAQERHDLAVYESALRTYTSVTLPAWERNPVGARPQPPAHPLAADPDVTEDVVDSGQQAAQGVDPGQQAAQQVSAVGAAANLKLAEWKKRFGLSSAPDNDPRFSGINTWLPWLSSTDPVQKTRGELRQDNWAGNALTQLKEEYRAVLESAGEQGSALREWAEGQWQDLERNNGEYRAAVVDPKTGRIIAPGNGVQVYDAYRGDKIALQMMLEDEHRRTADFTTHFTDNVKYQEYREEIRQAYIATAGPTPMVPTGKMNEAGGQIYAVDTDAVKRRNAAEARLQDIFDMEAAAMPGNFGSMSPAEAVEKIMAGSLSTRTLIEALQAHGITANTPGVDPTDMTGTGQQGAVALRPGDTVNLVTGKVINSDGKVVRAATEEEVAQVEEDELRAAQKAGKWRVKGGGAAPPVGTLSEEETTFVEEMQERGVLEEYPWSAKDRYEGGSYATAGEPLQEAADEYWKAGGGAAGDARARLVLNKHGYHHDTVFEDPAWEGIKNDAKESPGESFWSDKRAPKGGPRGFRKELETFLTKREENAGTLGGERRLKVEKFLEEIEENKGATGTFGAWRSFVEFGGHKGIGQYKGHHPFSGAASDRMLYLWVRAKEEGVDLPVFANKEGRGRAEQAGIRTVPLSVTGVTYTGGSAETKEKNNQIAWEEYLQWVSEAENAQPGEAPEGQGEAGEPYLRDVGQAAPPEPGFTKEDLQARERAGVISRGQDRAAQREGEAITLMDTEGVSEGIGTTPSSAAVAKEGSIRTPDGKEIVDHGDFRKLSAEEGASLVRTHGKPHGTLPDVLELTLSAGNTYYVPQEKFQWVRSKEERADFDNGLSQEERWAVQGGPFEKGYDIASAKEAGMKPEIGEDGHPHWESRIDSGKNEGLILKSTDHPTFWKTVDGEKKAGMVWYYDVKTERYYTFLKQGRRPRRKELIKREPVEGQDYVRPAEPEPGMVQMSE